MFITRTEALTTWVAPALLGAVLGMIAYLAVDLPVRTPVVSLSFVLLGIIVASLIAYGFRRFLLPPNVDAEDE